MNIFVFCHQVFRSKVFDSENMFVYLSVGLVIYKFIYMDLLGQCIYIYGPEYDKRYLWLGYLVAPAKYHLLGSFPENLKHLLSILTNIWQFKATYVIWFGM